MAPTPRPVAELFWPKVDVGHPCGCWVWSASKGLNGYGQFWYSTDGGPKVLSRAHRVAYELLVRPIADGLTLDHLCRNRACVNPDHLEPVTVAENIRRATGRHHCGNGHLFDAANTYRYTLKSGAVQRMCRACHRDTERARRAAKRVA